MSGSRFVVIGDVINDIVVVPRGEILVDADTTASVRPRPGGSAANTAAWLGTLGVDVDFVGCVGGDSLEWHSSALRDHGVTPHLKVEPGFATGTIVIVVEGGVEQPARRMAISPRPYNVPTLDGSLEGRRLVVFCLFRCSQTTAS